MTKRKTAIFTIVKNESFFLPIWLKHYQHYFENQDIWILDHESNDGSTANLDTGINIIPVNHNKAFDYQWMLDTVKAFQQNLLNDYECVLFTEVDELVYTLKGLDITINDFLLDTNTNFTTCRSYEIIHSFDEPGIAGISDIFDVRHYRCRYSNGCNKTLLSKVPLNWTIGFESIDADINFDYELYLAHIHRIDHETMYNRNLRASEWEFSEDNLEMNAHNRILDKDELRVYLEDHLIFDYIPEEHKNILKR